MYTDKVEGLVKTSIWIISWIGGILPLVNIYEKKVSGSAYLIFALSLLSEFVPQIKGKVHFIAKLIHTFFCGIILMVLCMAICFLTTDIALSEIIAFRFTIIIVVYIVVNFILLWLFNDDNDLNESIVTDFQDIQESAKIARYKFDESLKGGNLGNINKGE